MQRHHALSRLCWVVLALAAGCNGSRPPQVFPVKGRLMVGGQPAFGAHLAFHPVDQRFISRPVAIVQRDGSFRVMTHAVADGAPAGDYVVTVFWRDQSIPDNECECHDSLQHDLLAGSYITPDKSLLRATVRRENNELTFDIAAVSRPALPTPGRDRKRPLGNVFSFPEWADAEDE